MATSSVLSLDKRGWKLYLFGLTSGQMMTLTATVFALLLEERGQQQPLLWPHWWNDMFGNSHFSALSLYNKEQPQPLFCSC